MRVLITGTDSHVCKTWVGCALARALKHTDPEIRSAAQTLPRAHQGVVTG